METQAPPKFFEEQANQLKATLESKENVLRQFKLDHGIVELDKQKNALLDQIGNLETSISDASSQASAAQARIDSLSETLRRTPGKVQLTHVAGKTNYAADSYKGRLAELRQEETQMASRYPDDYRPLDEVRKQIKVIEASLAHEHETQTEVTTGVDVNYQNLQMNLEMEKATMKAQAARQESLKAEAVRLNGKLSALGAQEINLARLERETNALENEYTHKSREPASARWLHRRWMRIKSPTCMWCNRQHWL